MRFLVLILGMCGVASAAILARQGLAAGGSAVGLSAWRLVVASVCLILVQIAYKPAGKLESGDRIRLIIAGLFMAAHFATWIASLQYVSVARSTLLVSTAPVWAGIAGVFVPSLKPRPIFWLGLAICVVGAYVFTLHSSGTVHSKAPWIGDVLATIGAICIVPYLVLSQQVQSRTGTLRSITWIYAAAAVFLLALLAAKGEAAPPASAQVWLAILGMALFAQLLGHGMINYSLRFFTTPQIAVSTLAEPVFASALAWIFLRERIGPIEGLGGAILLFGIGVSLRGEPEQPQALP